MDHTSDASLFDILEECERRILVSMLEKCNWNQTEAAERFRVPLSTLNQKIKRLNIEIKEKILPSRTSHESLLLVNLDIEAFDFWFSVESGTRKRSAASV